MVFLCLPASTLPTGCVEPAASLYEALVLTTHLTLIMGSASFHHLSLVEIPHSTLQLCGDGNR